MLFSVEIIFYSIFCQDIFWDFYQTFGKISCFWRVLSFPLGEEHQEEAKNDGLIMFGDVLTFILSSPQDP